MIVFHVLNMYVYVHNALLLNQTNMYLVGKNSRVFPTVCHVNVTTLTRIQVTKKVIADNLNVQAVLLALPHDH
jgi:hypothetical protein